MNEQFGEERFAFWKGVATGVLGGIVIGALVRFVLSNSSAEGWRGEIRDADERIADDRSPEMSGPRRRRFLEIADQIGPRRDAPAHTLRFESRRDAAESAGDPRVTAPRGEVVPGGRAFERQGGAPGGRTPAETLEMPGRPGRLIDHSSIY